MAESFKSFQDAGLSEDRRRTTYPYDDWFNGDVWVLEWKKDYQTKTKDGIRMGLVSAAAKRGFTIEFRSILGTDKVAFRAMSVNEPS